MTPVTVYAHDKPLNSVDAIRQAMVDRLVYAVGKDLQSATQRDWLDALFYVVRDRIMDPWRESLAKAREQDAKRVYYLSMEFLTGRALTNAMLAAEIYEPLRQACQELGADFDA